jgi:uncharacterized protein YggE
LPARGYCRGGLQLRDFSVTVRTIAQAGSITDECLSAGATGIYGVSFGLSNEDAARAQATAEAVRDARTTAERLSRAARLRITGIKAVQIGAFPEVTVTVGVVFIAKP